MFFIFNDDGNISDCASAVVDDGNKISLVPLK